MLVHAVRADVCNNEFGTGPIAAVHLHSDHNHSALHRFDPLLLVEPKLPGA